MISSFVKTLLLFTALLMVSPAAADSFSENTNELSTQEKIVAHFQSKLSIINHFMAENHKKAIEDPDLLLEFIDKELMSVWSAKNTIRAMLGTKRWKGLSAVQEENLINSYTDTMRRYLFEVFSKYVGQKAHTEEVALNKKGNKGWLKVILEVPVLPDLSVDLKIYLSQGLWSIYDFRFQGISFISLKQAGYQKLFDEKGASGFVESLDRKNRAFKKALFNKRKQLDE